MARPGRVAAGLFVFILMFAVAGDFVARFWAQSVLAGRLREELQLTERPDVSLGGFPFVLHLARRRFPTATVTARTVQARDLEVDRLQMDLRDVRFSPGGGLVRTAGGEVEVVITDDQLSSYLRDRGASLEVRFIGPDVEVSAEAAPELGVEATATGSLRLRGETLRFRPETVEAGGIELDGSLFAFEVPLPAVIEGVRYESVSVQEGSAVVRARLEEAIVRLS